MRKGIMRKTRRDMRRPKTITYTSTVVGLMQLGSCGFMPFIVLEFEQG